MREKYPGVWELRVSQGVDPVTGRRLALSRSVRGSRRAADKALAQLVAEAEGDRQPKVEGTMTLAALVDEFLARWTGAATTLVGYRSLQENHIRTTIGRQQIRKVTPRLLDDFYRHLAEDKDLSASRIHQIHSVVRGALTMAVRWGWLAHNPARDVKPPTVRHTEVKIPSAETVNLLLRTASGLAPELGTLFRLAAATGARRSELSGLRWSNLDIEANTVRIERAVVSVGGTAVEKDTKNHSKRTVTLDDATIASLVSHRAAVAVRAAAARSVLREDAFIFSHEADGARPLHPDAMSSRWESVCKQAGVQGVRLHDLRHFQATMLLAGGVPLKNVSARIGHANASTTLNIYAHALESHDEGAADLIGNLLAVQPEPAGEPRGTRKRRTTSASDEND